MRTDATRKRWKLRDSYMDLIKQFPLASIKNEKHLKAAQRVIDEILSRGKLDEGEKQFLDALSDLVAIYEDAHHVIEPASDAEMLRHLMETKGMTQTKLSRETDISKSIISEVLAGKRPLSRQMIRTLSSYFRVHVSILAANI